MAQGYAQLGSITDPATRQLLQALFDQINDLQQQVETLRAAALQRGSPVIARARIMEVENPQAPGDAVNLRAMQRYVAAQLTTFAVQQVPPTYPVAPGVPGTPNALPSDALPLFDGTAIVEGVFAANPGLIPTSCQTAPGGNWDLMDAIVDALRAADPRFAYNGKRGNIHDPSHDAVAYDYGAVPGGEGATSVYIIDVIAGHCGASPGPAFQDVTVFAPGVWTGRGRF
jgi:hypothetical protein